MNILQWLDSNDVIHFAPERRDRINKGLPIAKLPSLSRVRLPFRGVSAGSFPETAAGNRVDGFTLV